MMKKRIFSCFFVLVTILSLAACGSSPTAPGSSSDNSANENPPLPTSISQADWNDSKQYAELSTGIKMAYVEMGDPTGDPVVLIHGGGGDTSRTFSLMAPYLAKAGFHVYSIDRKGNGDSSKPEIADYDMWSEASDVAAFIQAMGYKKANIVGHSMGGAVCQAFLILYPEMVDKLAYYPGMLWSAAEYEPLTDADLNDAYYESWTYNDLPEEAVTEEFKEFLQYEIENAKRISAKTLNLMTRGSSCYDNTIALNEVKVDHLFIWSTLDYTPPEQVAAVLSSTENSRFLVYDGVGHNIQWEIPEQLAKDVIAYFRGETPPSGYTDKEAFIASNGTIIQPLA